MKSLRHPVYRVRIFFAEHRTSVVALAGAASSTTLAFAITDGAHRRFWVAAFVLLSVLLVIASEIPSRYRKIDLAQSFMRVIHQSMLLGQNDRVTLHHVLSQKREQYEQLVDYYPTSVGRGRRYSFSSGIVGSAIKKKMAQAYSVPDGMSWEEAMREDWSFTEDELARLSRDRLSFFAYPLMDSDGHVLAVLFFDSPQASQFTDANKVETEARIKQWFESTLLLLLKE